MIAGLCLVLAVASLMLLPHADSGWVQIPYFVPFYAATVFLTNTITAVLVFGQFYRDRAGSLLVLGAAYLFAGLMVIPHLLSFPEFAPMTFGKLQTSLWIWHLWHLGFPVLVLFHVLALGFGDRWRLARTHRPWSIAATVLLTFGAVALLTAVATVKHDALPPLYEGRHWSPLAFEIGWLACLATLAALGALWGFTGGRTMLHLWLSVVLVAFLFEIVPTLLALSRYNVGWYVGRVNGLVSAGFLLVMFMGEINRLYGYLARALEEGREANDLLGRALRDKETLLREVYHRVKNNLQAVDSLIAVEESRLPHPDAKQALEDLRRRVAALGLVHQRLMRAADLETVSSDVFLTTLCRHLAQSAGADAQGITVSVRAEPVPLNLDLGSNIGLLVTELVSNAFKHAFPSGSGGTVTVALHGRADGTLALTVADNGRGMGPLTACGTPRRASIGWRIVQALADTLKAEMVVHTDGGTTVMLVIPPRTAATGRPA